MREGLHLDHPNSMAFTRALAEILRPKLKEQTNDYRSP
jgi:hypothetical protein